MSTWTQSDCLCSASLLVHDCATIWQVALPISQITSLLLIQLMLIWASMQHYSSSASEPVSILAMLRRFPDNRKVCPLFCTLIGIEGFVEAVVYVERNDWGVRASAPGKGECRTCSWRISPYSFDPDGNQTIWRPDDGQDQRRKLYHANGKDANRTGRTESTHLGI